MFRDKSIPDAIKLFLAAQRRKQTGKEIATGLLAGGLVSTSKRFEATVHGVLHRLKVAGVVLRFKEGWDLAESYPEHLRNRIANGTSSTSKPKPKKKAKRRRTKKSEAQPEDGLETRIESFLNSHQMGVFVPAEISKAVGGDVRIVRLSLARMVKKKKARKHPDADDSYTAYRKNMDALRAV